MGGCSGVYDARSYVSGVGDRLEDFQGFGRCAFVC